MIQNWPKKGKKHPKNTKKQVFSVFFGAKTQKMQFFVQQKVRVNSHILQKRVSKKWLKNGQKRPKKAKIGTFWGKPLFERHFFGLTANAVRGIPKYAHAAKMSKKWPQKWVKNSQKWPIFGQKRVDFFWKSFWPVFDSKFPKIVANRPVGGTPKMTIFGQEVVKKHPFLQNRFGECSPRFLDQNGSKSDQKVDHFFSGPRKTRFFSTRFLYKKHVFRGSRFSKKVIIFFK